MTRRARLVASTALAACVLVPLTASASASDDARVTWEQVRVALAAARGPASPQHPAPSHPAPTHPSPPSHPPPPTPVPPSPPSHHPHPTPTPTPEPTPEPTPGPGSGAVTVTVTIPDLSWALDDPTAPPGVRRAACHQATGLDDETAAPLAACLAWVRGPVPHHWQPPHR